MNESLPKILIVDDDKDIRDGFVRRVKEQIPGYDLVVAKTLKEAKDLLESGGVVAVITDNGFPPGIYNGFPPSQSDLRIGSTGEAGGAGLLLISELRKGNFGMAVKDIPVAFTSADLRKSKIIRARSFGGITAAFSKNEQKDEVVKFISDALAGLYNDIGRAL